MKDTRGFTLLETLLAVVVLGTAVAAAMSVLSTSLRNVSRTEDYQRVVLLARAQMNELLALPSWSDGQVWRGDWRGGQANDFRWTARAQRVPEPGKSPQPGGRELIRLVLVATWQTSRGEKTLELETVRLQVRVQ